MWANAQRGGRPVECSWRPLFNAAKFGWRPILECRASSNASKTRNPLKFAGVPQTPEPISAVSGPKFTILWGHVEEILLLNAFSDFRYVHQLRRYSPTKLCDGVQMAIFWVLHFQRAARSTFQTCILNSHKGHTMCRSMVDIHCATAEIRRGNQER